jgi:hypothetical protein
VVLETRAVQRAIVPKYQLDRKSASRSAARRCRAKIRGIQGRSYEVGTTGTLIATRKEQSFRGSILKLSYCLQRNRRDAFRPVRARIPARFAPLLYLSRDSPTVSRFCLGSCRCCV